MEALIEPFLDNAFMQRALVAGVSVAIACPTISTPASMLCFFAKLSEHTIAAAAPQVGGQHISLVK